MPGLRSRGTDRRPGGVLTTMRGAASRTAALCELVVDRAAAGIAFEGHRRETGGLVDDDEAVVFVDDVEVAEETESGTGFRAAGTVDPVAKVVPLGQRPGRVADRRFVAVDVDLAALE